MAWRCAECGEPETGKTKIDVVCHHCGKPLCKDHRITMSGDVFSVANDSVRNLAYHCSDCCLAHHATTNYTGHQG